MIKLLNHSLKHTVYSLILFLQDGFILAGMLFFGFWLRFDANIPFFRKVVPQDITSYWFAFFIALYLVLSQMVAFRLYNFDRFRTWREDCYAIIKSVSIAAFLLLAMSFFYRKIDFSRQMVLMTWPLTIVALVLGRLFFRSLLLVLRRKGYHFKNVLILGQGPMLSILSTKLDDLKSLGLSASAILTQEGVQSEDRSDLPLRGSYDDLEKVIQEDQIHVVLLLDEHFDHERLLKLVEFCESKNIELLLVPQVFDLLIDFSSLREFSGIPFFELREEPIKLGTIAIKRIFDFCAALFSLILLSPVFLVIILLIRLDSKGPAIFFQKRVGYRGRCFRMLKFRSMVENAEEKLKEVVDLKNMDEPVFKLKDDPRVTRVGRWLRRTSLDELPQLVNVLLGQMSLVGPRPEEEAMAKQYNVWQRRRLKIKPGITGLQQIKCRGSTSLSERVKYDIFYIRKISLLLDLEIMLRTVWVVMKQDGAH